MTTMRILLVEDDVGDAILVRESLADCGQAYELEHHTRMADALLARRAGEFDVMLCDLNLPDSPMSQTLHHVASLSAELPIIMLTGLDDREVSVRAVNAGAQDYIAKDRVSPEGLRRAITHGMERHRLRREQEILLASLKRSNEELRKATKQKEEFVAIASHELRTPVTVVQGFLELLQDRGDRIGDAERKQMIAGAYRNARRLAELTDDLLMVSRMTGVAQTTSFSPVRIIDVVTAAVDGSQASIADVDLDVDPDLLALADASKLERMMANLLTNACRYGAPPISIEARKRGQDVHLAVRDRGDGVADEFVPSLFDHFTQAAPSETREHQGAGLGLAIVKGLAVAMGGSAWYEHARPGARFVISLPLFDHTASAPPSVDLTRTGNTERVSR